MKLSQLCREFESYCRNRRGFSRETLNSYSNVTALFLRCLTEHRRPDDVSVFDADAVETFATWLTGRGAKANSVRHHLSTVSSLAKFGMKTRTPRGWAIPRTRLPGSNGPARSA